MKALEQLKREVRAEVLVIARAHYWAERSGPDYVPKEWLPGGRRLGRVDPPDVRPPRG